MNRHPIFIEDGQKSLGQKSDLPTKPDDTPPEDELGGGDICSLEEQPPTDDDKPLD